MPPCRHCGTHKMSRPRGLCWGCYLQAEVRALYPIRVSKYNRRGYDNRSRIPPAAPTDALPGTPEKIAVLHKRARLGMELWHPDDAPCVGLPRRRLRRAG